MVISPWEELWILKAAALAAPLFSIAWKGADG